MPTLSPSPATPKTANNITAALALNPHFIIVNLPSNDTNAGISLSETMANFSAVKDAADAQGVKIFFTTTQPRNFVNLSLRDELQTQANLIRDAFGDYVIDIYDELTDFDNNKAIKAIYDFYGIHVNNAGHEYIFNTTRDKLIPVLTNYEVFRAQEEAGPYTMITRTSVTSMEDTNLLPGTTYWYQVRTVDFNGASGFSSIDSATTHTDNQPPTTPTGVTITSSTFSTVSLVWNASTDNVGVTGYEVYGNGDLIGSTDIIGILITDLSPGTTYNFTVLAVDASGNKSGLSTVVSTTTPAPAVYYSTPTGNLNLTSNWGTASDGSGTHPAGFDFNGTHYVVSNRTTSSLGGSWTVEGAISKVVVPDNVTLTADNSFTARVEVQGSGQVILDNATVPTFIALSSNSTVQYNAASSIQQNTYGNLALGGSGTKTFFSGTTLVNGNLTIGNGISLKGAPENNTRLVVAGNVTINGTPQFVADDFGIKLELTGSGTKTISSAGDLYLDEIITSGASTVNVVSTGSPYNIRLGGEGSGGLTLANGSKLNVGNNTLFFKKQAVVNAANETGRIAINGGNILFVSTSALSSNLYFDPAANAINRFEVDLSGAGNIVVREAARVTDGLKIHRGTINANGQLMLASTALKTANLEMIENNGQVTGDLIVQRHMEPEGRIWKYISTPVEGVTVADWQNSGLPITGNFTGASTGPGLGSSPSLYYYNNGWVAYPSPQPGGSNNAPIQRGVGYSAFIRNEVTPTVLQVSGNPFQHDIPFTLTGGSGGDTGWNLLGNPYASTIVWNNSSAWTSSGINSTISVRNNPNGQLLIWDAATGIGNLPGGKIAPGQAFWVQATSANPSLTITEQAKTVDQQEFYRQGSDQEYAIVKLVRGALEDPAYILFNNTSDNYEANADAYKRPNEGMFSISTLTADGVPVAINKLNETFCSKTVNLKFENVTAGEYKLVVENITSLSRIQQVVLRDNLLNTTVTNDAEYTFDITSDPTTFSTDRFTLTFQRSEIDMPVFVSASPICEEDFSTITLANTEYGTRYSVINQANEVIAGPFDGTAANTTLQVAAEALAFGTNALRVQVLDAVCDGSPVILPAQIQVVRNTRPEVTVNNYLIICEGSSATLTATGTAGTTSYLWTNQVGETLGNSNVLTIPVVHANSFFNVAAIGPNGCVGEVKSIIVLTEQLDVPEITVTNDTLFTNHTGNLQWYKDGEPMFNETRNYFVPTQTGTYQVRAASTSGGCIQASDDFIFVVTSTESGIGGIHRLEVFPNPAAQEQVTVVLHTSEHGPVELKLVDMFGRTVYLAQHSSTEAQHGIYINAKHPLATGMYLVIGTQGNASMTKKLIIK
jgi:chitodextrinase